MRRFLGCLGVLLLTLPVTLELRTANPVILGVDGYSFTINGRSKFLVFVSYFDGLDVSDANLALDFAWLKSKGVDGVRVFPNWWNQFGTTTYYSEDTLIDENGDLDSTRLSKLHSLLGIARSSGLVVDLSFSGENVKSCSGSGCATSSSPEGTLTKDELRSGLEDLTTDLQTNGYTNVLIDIQNEVDYNTLFVPPSSRATLDDDDIEDIADAIHAINTSQVVTASLSGGSSASSAGTVAATDGLNAATWHETRNTTWWNATNSNVAAIRGQTTKPVYLQEPKPSNESGWTLAGTALNLRVAIASGAAAWTFHTRSSFELNSTRLQTVMTGDSSSNDRDFMNQLPTLLGPARMSRYRAATGTCDTTYSAASPVTKYSANQCLAYCAAQGGDSCEWIADSGYCYVETGQNCAWSAGTSNRYSYSFGDATGFQGLPSGAEMLQYRANTGSCSTTYSAASPTTQSTAVACLAYCAGQGAEQCEWVSNTGDCYAEQGQNCAWVAGASTRYGYSFKGSTGFAGIPANGQMRQYVAQTGTDCTTSYSASSPTTKSTAASCLSYCASQGGDACEWSSDTQNCYVEQGQNCTWAAGASTRYGYTVLPMQGYTGLPGGAEMRQYWGNTGNCATTYAAGSPTTQASAAACLSYCAGQSADQCEWMASTGACYSEQGQNCVWVQSSSDRYGYSIRGADGYPGLKAGATMVQYSANTGACATTYAAGSPTSHGTAASCLAYCASQGADQCEWASDTGNCFSEQGENCVWVPGTSTKYGYSFDENGMAGVLPNSHGAPGNLPRPAPEVMIIFAGTVIALMMAMAAALAQRKRTSRSGAIVTVPASMHV